MKALSVFVAVIAALLMLASKPCEVRAAETSPPTAPTETPPTPNGSATTPDRTRQSETHVSDAKIVENWITMSGQFNESLLTTVYWALGVACAMLVALIGVGWFVNYKTYERDKAAMLHEIHAEISENVTRMEQSMREVQEQQSRRLATLAKEPTQWASVERSRVIP